MAAPLSCSSKKPDPVAPMAPSDGGLEGGADAASDSASATAASTIAVPSAPIVPPTLGGEVMDGAIDLALKVAAAKDAAGMTAEGAPGRGSLKEGDHTSLVFTMQPGRCYTIIGYSPPGQVSNLELKTLAPPLYTLEAGRSGGSDKNLPIVGRGKAAQCPVIPLPVSYRIDATAKKGGGRVGIQVFSKAK